MRQQLRRDVGGTLVFTLPSVPAPGTAEISITRYSGAALEDAAVTDAALADPFLYEGALSAVEGDAYLSYEGDAPPAGETAFSIYDNTGRMQDVLLRTVSVVDGVVTLATQPALEFSAATGSIRGRTVRYEVTADNCPRIESNFRVEIVYTDLDDAQGYFETTYDVGLGAHYNPATMADVQAAWPAVDDETVTQWRNTSLVQALRNGYDMVERHLSASGRNINRIRNREVVVPLIVNKTLRSMAYSGVVPSAWAEDVPEWIGLLDGDYDSLFGSVLAAIAWYDDDDDGAASDEELAGQVLSVRLVK